MRKFGLIAHYSESSLTFKWLFCSDKYQNEPPHDKTNSVVVRPAKTQIWACAQSDQSLCCPHEENLGPYLPIERPAKTLIRLPG